MSHINRVIVSLAVVTLVTAGVLISVNRASSTGFAAAPPLDPASVRDAARAAGLDSLSTVAIPPVPDIGDFLNAGPEAQRGAVVLGKALFWDMQVGSDGQACASCHFAAGADNRSKNDLSPGLKGNPPDTAFGNPVVKGASGHPDFAPNYVLSQEDFPQTALQDPLEVAFNSRSMTRETDDIVSSQGVFMANFAGTVPGELHDKGVPAPDPIFNVDGVNVRRVPPRNTPSVVNAVFNFNNFWDGRASEQFNGVSPLGPLDADAKILVLHGDALAEVRISIPNSSLASQAVGPPLSDMEMSYAGRTFPDIGKKLAGGQAAGIPEGRSRRQCSWSLGGTRRQDRTHHGHLCRPYQGGLPAQVLECCERHNLSKEGFGTSMHRVSRRRRA